MFRFVFKMFSVGVHTQVRNFDHHIRHVSCDCLLYVAIKPNQLVLLKSIVVYLWISGIKRQP